MSKIALYYKVKVLDYNPVKYRYCNSAYCKDCIEPDQAAPLALPDWLPLDPRDSTATGLRRLLSSNNT